MENPLEQKDPVYRIGIAMAGAVSAGAYTAGVMDYLFEALQNWEKAKANNRRILKEFGPDTDKGYDPSIPMHDAVIEAIGGASAGGITAAVGALALFEGINPVNSTCPDPNANKLFDTWVNLNDSQGNGKTTFLQMLETSDVLGRQVLSILNSDPIDQIADRAKDICVNLTVDSDQWPSYISKELELILTICNLRGIPLNIYFGTADDYADRALAQQETVPAHKMYLHKGIAHFCIGPNRFQDEHILPLNPHNALHRTALIESAKATGAFPIGLKARFIQGIPKSYIIGQIKRMFGNEHINIDWTKIPEYYDFMAIDGGTINNEPFDEVVKVLEERFLADNKGLEITEDTLRDYAIMMIDPFPNFQEGSEDGYTPSANINGMAPPIISAIRRQAMIKESELSKGFTKDNTRHLIFPVRRDKKLVDGEWVEEKVPYAIACGSLDGFGGFFSRDFREHDFYLGRKNCQSFLRKHFCLPETDVFQYKEDGSLHIAHKAFEKWLPGNPIYDRFSYEKNGIAHFPIVPDMNMVNANSKDPLENGSIEGIPLKKMPMKQLAALKKPLRKRVNKILLSLLLDSFTAKPAKAKSKQEKKQERSINKLVNKHLNTRPAKIFKIFTYFLLGALALIISPVLLLLIPLLWWLMTQIITSMILKTITADFHKRELLEE